MPSPAIRALKNCGSKTVAEIQEIQSSLNPTLEESIADEQNFVPRALPANIDDLLPLVMSRLEDLSVRAKNAFIFFLEDHQNSLTRAYATFTNPKFNPVKMKNIGKGTVGEIKGLLNDIRIFLESLQDENAVKEAVTKFYANTLDDLHIPADAQNEIHELENSLGHFPLFTALKSYFEELEGEERTIIDGLFIIHEGQVPRDKNDVATELSLSPERVRQKRNKLVDKLGEYFASYRTLGFVNECPYIYQMRRINEEINAEEGTDFNLNFINWVLASVFDEVTLLGDVAKTITGYYDKNYFLCLVPANLCQYMDFNDFLEDVESRLAEKRINEERVNLQNLINAHLKTQYCEDEMPAIETACRSILYLHYPVDVDFGQVIFKPNARKNNPIVIEEIIRAAGHPLTLEEIYEEFIYQYPERYTEMTTLRGSINNNSNIIPIGHTSTYSLIEWDGQNGGSIRGLVADYLHGLEPSIAPMSEITKHVCQFRPTTTEYSILTNLSLDKSVSFAFFFREGIRYIGLSQYSYPIEFFRYSGDAHNASAMSIGYPKLVSFIKTNGRFPFSSGVDDYERKLYVFWRKQKRHFETGELSASGKAYHTMILNEFGHLQMDKNEYEWRNKYDMLWSEFVEIGPSTLDIDADSVLSRFYANMMHDYRYSKDSMPEWKREAVEKLLNHLQNTDNVQNNLG